MEFEQEPDYQQLRQMLYDVAISDCGQFNDDYDWMPNKGSSSIVAGGYISHSGNPPPNKMLSNFVQNNNLKSAKEEEEKE